MESDLRERILGATEKWDGAPEELVQLKQLLSVLGKEVFWNPNEMVNNMLVPNETRTHFLREVLQPFYVREGFWSDESPEGILHKCFLACEELGIEVTQQILDGKGSIEESLDMWRKILTPRKRLSTEDSENPPKGRKPSNSTERSADKSQPQQLESVENEKLEQKRKTEYNSDSEDSSKSFGNLHRTDSNVTASFTELPDIHGDHVDVDKHGNYVKPKPTKSVKLKATHVGENHEKPQLEKRYESRHSRGPLSPSTPQGSAKGSALARYDGSTSADESTQAGIASWDWLARLEQLLVHFFLIIFDSSADSSRLMMELMPKEATKQIEEIFRLLLQAEPEMYHNLGHIVSLAEKWLVHWGGDSEHKTKALEFVRLYLIGVKDKKYYTLPVQVRLRKLGAFIAGLKTIEDEGVQANFDEVDASMVPNVLPYALKYVKALHPPSKRPPSPRVKPAAHFARVVASILCDRPCNRPLSPPGVYADDLAKTIFQNPLHGDRGFQSYVDEKYGEKYAKKDIFMRELPKHIANSINPRPPSRIPVENKHCWLPIYNKSYIERVDDGDCCSVNDDDKRTGGREKSTRRKRRGTEDGENDDWIITANGKPVRRRRQRQRRRTDDDDDDYEYDDFEESVIVGPDGKVIRRRRSKSRAASRRKLGQRIKRNSRRNVNGYDSDEEWVHDPKGQRVKRKPGRFAQVGDPDYSSEEEWVHDKTGKRAKRKHPLTDGRRPQAGDPEYSSDEEWVHDINGKRQKRKKPLRGGQRPQPGDLDYDSGEEWEHDKVGKRVKRRNHGRTKSRRNMDGYDSDEEWVHDPKGQRVKRKPGRFAQVGDPDYSSEEEWVHDKTGKRAKRKHPLTDGRRPQAGDPEYSSDEEWVHDINGKRQKRKKPLRGGQRPTPGDLDYDSDEEWEHDKVGKRVKRRNHGRTKSRRNVDGYDSDEEWVHDPKGQRVKRKPGRFAQVGDPDYSSEEEWVHDKNGKRAKRKHRLTDGRRPQAGDPEYSSDEEWVHDINGKRQKRKKPLRGGQRPQPGDLDYDSDEEWEHDKVGKRVKRRNHPKSKRGHNPELGDSDSDSDEAWIQDRSGKRIKKRRAKPGDGDFDDEDDILNPRRKLSRGGTHAYTVGNARPPGRRSNKNANDLAGNGDSKGPRGRKKSGRGQDGRRSNNQQYENDEDDLNYPDGSRRQPSWMSTLDNKVGKIKVKGVFRSQADFDEQLKKAHNQRKEAALPKVTPGMSVLAMRPTMKDSEKFVKKSPPKSPAAVLKDLNNLKRGESLEEDDFDEPALLAMLDNNRNATVYTAVVDTSQMESQMSNLHKTGCPASLWGLLPIPAGDLLQNSQIPCAERSLRVPIQPNNVLREDTTGAFGDYASIPANVTRYKQIFRDEARALGLPRPSTAEVTSRMIERTAKNVRKKIEEEDLADLLDPNKKTREADQKARPKTKINRTKRFEPKKRSVPLASVLFDLMKRNPEEFGSNESESGLLRDDQKNHKKYGPPGDLHPGVMDEIAIRFHGVTSGPFIPHVDRSHRNRISFSLEDKPQHFFNTKPSFKGNGDAGNLYMKRGGGEAHLLGEDEDEAFQMNEEEGEGMQLPNLAVREKTSSNPIIRSNESPMKLPSIDNVEEEGYTYTDKLLYPSNSNPEANLETQNKKTSLRKSGSLRGSKKELASRLPALGTKSKVLTQAQQYQALGGQGDQDLVGSMNPCWDMASKLFKTPLRAPAMPLPDNLVIHIEKKCPGLQWPRGVPVALRYYPSGQPFCVVFQNGAGRVHYPHGGLAVAISAPTPTYSRVVVIRDPFDQFYFFDKAILADLNCNGTGTVYDEHGIIKVQYNLQGGYRQEGVDKPSQRWQWNEGGQRLIIKLNRYMGLRILDLNKIYLVFYGNKRGFRLNVGAGQRVNLMSVTCDSSKSISRHPERPKSACGGFDYIRGRFSTPVLGFLDKSRKERCMTAAANDLQPVTYKYSFSQCHLTDAGDPCKNHDCYQENCRDDY